MSSDQVELKAPVAKRGLTRPWSVMVAVTGLSLLWAWFSTSVVEFNGPPSLAGFHTGGWFLLGSPFVLGFSLAVALAFCALARRSNEWIAVGLCAVLLGSLTAFTIIGKLPSSRLPGILGELDWKQIQIHRFRIHDSFNEGETTEGILGVSPQMFTTINGRKNLIAKEYVSLGAFNGLNAGALPANGTVWSDGITQLFYDDVTGWLYFSHRTGQSR